MAESKATRGKPATVPDPAEAEGELSLEKLSAAFAEMLGDDAGDEEAPEILPLDDARQVHAQRPGRKASGASMAGAKASVAAPPTANPEEDPDRECEITPLSILESLLFVGDPAGAGLSSERLASVMRGVEATEIHDMVRELNRRYLATGCPYCITSEGALYRLTLRPEFDRIREKFYGRVRQTRLSQAAIDVLALVAYNESLTGEDINRIRGVPSGSILSQLVRRQLLRVERTEGKPPVMRYFTTPRFLGLFGLETLNDLPRSRDLEQN